MDQHTREMIQRCGQNDETSKNRMRPLNSPCLSHGREDVVFKCWLAQPISEKVSVMFW